MKQNRCDVPAPDVEFDLSETFSSEIEPMSVAERSLLEELFEQAYEVVQAQSLNRIVSKRGEGEPNRSSSAVFEREAPATGNKVRVAPAWAFAARHA